MHWMNSRMVSVALCYVRWSDRAAEPDKSCSCCTVVRGFMFQCGR